MNHKLERNIIADPSANVTLNPSLVILNEVKNLNISFRTSFVRAISFSLINEIATGFALAMTTSFAGFWDVFCRSNLLIAIFILSQIESALTFGVQKLAFA